MTQTITALFDKPAEAEAAQAKLVAAGIPQSSIRLVRGAEGTTTRTTGSYDRTRDEGGFWGSLKEFFMPEEDRYAYSEGLSRGGTLLTVTADGAHVETAYDIVEQNGSVDLDERETTWRKGGWTGYSATSGTTTGMTAGMSGASTTTGSTGASALRSGEASDAVAARGTTAHGAVAGETDYIPVVEERLNVGKRLTEGGRVRVRSYAVEKAVSENVTLHDETVHVDRRTVDRPVTAADEALFADKVIEATEMREEAVVSKDARVVGEVGIRKDATQRTETVSDKVRHTEVEVEDGHGTVSRTGVGGTTTEATDPAARKPL